MLPRLDGITLCQRLHAAKCNAFIMLTARDTKSDKIVGLDAGADDYLVKPFELEELAARIRALSRRSQEETWQPILTRGNLQLNPSTCNVTYADKVLSLTPKEYMILECFLRNPNQVLTRSAILDKLWEFDKLSGSDTVKTHITNLRKKLTIAKNHSGLITVKSQVGIGSCFTVLLPAICDN